MQSDFQPVDENKFLINIADIDNINHIVIFLTGATPLPLGSAGGMFMIYEKSKAHKLECSPTRVYVT